MTPADSLPTPPTTRRRWFAPRFGLRTLLILVATVCVSLAFVPHEAREYSSRKARVEKLIGSWGGKIEFAGWSSVPSPGTNWLSLKLGYGEPLEKLWNVSFFFADLTHEQVQEIGVCSWIRSLELSLISLDDSILDHVANIRQLHELRISGAAITDKSLARLKPLDELIVLDVRGTSVTYAGLAELERDFKGSNFREQHAIGRLAGLLSPSYDNFPRPKSKHVIAYERPQRPGINSIYIGRDDGIQVTPDQIVALSHLKGATRLFASGAVFPAGGLDFLRDLRNLKWVAIRDSKTASLSDDDLSFVAELPKLEQLELEGRHLTDAGIANLIPCGDKLQSLTLKADQLTPEALCHISRLGGLKCLDFDVPITADNVDAFRQNLTRLASLPKLETLRITSDLRAAELTAIVTCVPPLRNLRVRGMHMSNEIWRQMETARPDISIEWQVTR